MKALQLAAAVALLLTFALVDATCDKLDEKVKKFEWCRSKGFKSTIEGCPVKAEGTLKKKQVKTCRRYEKALKKCDYSCNDPLDGGWSDFGEWSECTVKCGGGTQNRSKSCTNPAPANGGKNCEGKSTESRTCNTEACYIQTGIAGSWQQIPGGLTKVSTGKSGVWGVINNMIFRLNTNGKSWDRIQGGLAQVSSGTTVWGVTSDGKVFRYQGSHKWELIAGGLSHVDVSNKGHVWGVNKNQDIFRWTGSAFEQVDIGGKLIQVSVGDAGVWGVNAKHNILYRQGTAGDVDTAGSGWTVVEGGMKWVASGTNLVVGVNSANEIFYRKGISAENPTGSEWVKVPGGLIMIDVDDKQVVAINSAHNIFRAAVGPV